MSAAWPWNACGPRTTERRSGTSTSYRARSIASVVRASPTLERRSPMRSACIGWRQFHSWMAPSSMLAMRRPPRALERRLSPSGCPAERVTVAWISSTGRTAARSGAGPCVRTTLRVPVRCNSRIRSAAAPRTPFTDSIRSPGSTASQACVTFHSLMTPSSTLMTAMRPSPQTSSFRPSTSPSPFSTRTRTFLCMMEGKPRSMWLPEHPMAPSRLPLQRWATRCSA
mmetsp:Transcript_86645/g.223168  ORF Transcript_86645/g.223168 Transcript_86645/m.223168 type:complete len:226 (-) Transcript_86645:34-711(-)